MTDKQPQQGGTLVPYEAEFPAPVAVAMRDGKPPSWLATLVEKKPAAEELACGRHELHTAEQVRSILAAAHEHYAAQVAAMAQPQGDAAMPVVSKIDARFQVHNQGAWVPQQMWDELKAAIAARDAEIERLRSVLRFYAHGNHMILADENAWDTVSGEEENWWCDEAGTATIEDGSFAVGVLSGQPLDWGDDGPPAPLAEEEAGTADGKIPITREWCIAAAQAELASESDPTVGAGPAPEAAQQLGTYHELVRQATALAEATRSQPGVAVPMPTLLATEGKKFMRGEPSLFDQVPLGEMQSITDAVACAPEAAQPADTEAQTQEVMRRVRGLLGPDAWHGPWAAVTSDALVAIESTIRRLVGGK